ncbi:unnamed protein product [Penicillium olsonii]|nr:unnamed protein product [Penicillium olsonii]
MSNSQKSSDAIPNRPPSPQPLTPALLFERFYAVRSLEMGKKRRGPSLEELLDRPWCYYCERDFDDLKILISHQKAKHFKCDRCNRRLNTAGGLSVHLSQVHKEQLTEVDNALPNRMGLEVEIFGMEGIPDEVLKAHQQRVATQFQQEELERQAVTGNPPAGSTASGQPAKKPKVETTSDLKKRLAEHKAKRAAQALGGVSSGDVTPAGASQTPTGAVSSAQSTPTPTPGFPQPYSYPQPYGGNAAAAAPSFSQTASPSYPTYSPVGGPQGAGASPYTPTGHPQAFPAGLPAQPPVSYGAPPSFGQQPPAPENKGIGLPAASHLPQRPAFAAPPVNAHQMQQMHMGHQVPTPATTVYSNGHNTPAPAQTPIDDQVPGAQDAAKTEGAEKPAKKEKTKPAVRMIYNHDTLSPEERMAQLPRYAWKPDHSAETVLGDVPDSTIVGAIQDSDTVLDPAH